nr:helix-turn-helix transcriptional regulator [Streptomyces alboniger]
MSQSKVSRIENGKVRPTLVDVERLFTDLEAPPALVAEVSALARLAAAEWQDAGSMCRKGLDKTQLELAGLEAPRSISGSSSCRCSRPAVDPEYIRAGLEHIPGGGDQPTRHRSDVRRVDGRDVRGNGTF